MRKNTYKISKENKSIIGKIELESSKSISNRVLMIRALCDQNFEIKRLSRAKDTETLENLLTSVDEKTFDAGNAGTSFRFMTAFLAVQQGTQIMTGSERMQQRPIGELVSVLNELGADIKYLKNEGFPPLQINSPKGFGNINEINISAHVSSQFITAILLIAPTLPNGLTLNLVGDIVSKPYIEMTIAIMGIFGIKYTWIENTIKIISQKYIPNDFEVESDWSAASYYYSLAVFAEELDLKLIGLHENSLQGDRVIATIMKDFGIETIFEKNGIRLIKKEKTDLPFFEYNFLKCPDIAQTLAVICSGIGIQGVFSGLETLKIKETNRIDALKKELSKINTNFYSLPKRFSQKTNIDYYMIENQAK